MPDPTGADISEYPVPAFYFKVVIDMHVTSFQEVAGISSEIQFEEVKEGGENRFVHQLPKGVKPGTLVLKRGILQKSAALYTWCQAALSGNFDGTCRPKTATVSLLNGEGQPVFTWNFTGVYPAKWEIDPFNSTKNDVAIEKISLRYNTVTRTI